MKWHITLSIKWECFQAKKRASYIAQHIANTELFEHLAHAITNEDYVFVLLSIIFIDYTTRYASNDWINHFLYYETN